ncbi:enoyl-CoA hydratase/isomerase family protein [Pseudoduganella namucuonensis]|uniref:2-(1,2-epoxy-1,2-dihydrophenyl)acetyl-CoA isomerase n=1 Tax=Pseudoduganella namucuonensis TaxID=1035707 RepID=A0A1I7LSH3_9BURK|nr:enoyl-CoA hydratase-related protein [Pseudoduganella namucuonensis]SFV12657.1 2-(1,2-epoxy-1,2-dihydrophenyl)acetyl-CoA isomerase [Pseudoduganella namucuonensis]
MTMQDQAVLLEREGAIARIVLNRPAVLNAVDVEMAEALLAAIKAVAGDPAVRVVVLKGAGKAFMAGGNLACFQADPAQAERSAERLIRPLNEAVLALTQLPVPVIASLRGPVAGAGVSLALACDLAVAADNVSFNLAYARIGASPDVSGSWYLPRIVGLRKAMEIALLTGTVEAAEAGALGLVNRVVAAGRLDEETDCLARRLASGATAALGATKRLLHESHTRGLAEQLEAERAAFCACTRTGDFAEGVAAFYARRGAEFTGR